MTAVTFARDNWVGDFEQEIARHSGPLSSPIEHPHPSWESPKSWRRLRPGCETSVTWRERTLLCHGNKQPPTPPSSGNLELCLPQHSQPELSPSLKELHKSGRRWASGF
ncbi:Hypothetical predicted protein [Podarcis lilfordi]|uniref:Uncharacterized protein n=1 Tax=Podarcis lilfordi TaxID=74358 RepID=A0AA35KC39_9SAUR|nr:Hypothetical predicted protein [Podarcis lilfordi]